MLSSHPKDLRETQEFAPNYPMIGGADLSISTAWRMLPALTPGSSEGRTAADNQTVRSVFIVGPDTKIKLIIAYPMTTVRNFDEVLRVLAATHGNPQSGHAGQLEVRLRRDHRRLRRGCEEAVPSRVETAAAVHPHRCAAENVVTAETRVRSTRHKEQR